LDDFRVTLRNYRAFSDEAPAVLQFGSGFTALIGSNNVGKSSAKRAFYELRPLFDLLVNFSTNATPSFVSLLQGGIYSFSYLGVVDPHEIFHNGNDRALTVEIELVHPVPYISQTNPPTDILTKIVLRAERSTPNSWTMLCAGLRPENSPFKSASGWRALGQNLIENASGDVRFSTEQMSTVIGALAKSKYYGAFRNAINVGGADYYDLRTGTAFVDLWNTWKTSGSKAQNRAVVQITEDIRRLFEFQQLEINSSASLQTLIVLINGQPYRLAELGSGIAQFIIVLGNAATSDASFVFIDEPELNLHPALQIDFLLAIAQYASAGCIFSTHSVGLARSVAQKIYSFKKVGGNTLVRPFEATTSYAEFLGELSFSAFKDFGHERILLVEGVNDVKVVQQFLRLLGKEHTTVILPLGGNQLASGGREAELSEITRLSDRVFAIVDSERIGLGLAPDARRQAFAETCEKLNISVCLTERRAIENYFTDKAVKAGIGGSFEALSHYQALNESKNAWNKSNNWKIARQMTVEELSGTDIGQFFATI
jgi:hypothetical protein